MHWNEWWGVKGEWVAMICASMGMIINSKSLVGQGRVQNKLEIYLFTEEFDMMDL